MTREAPGLAAAAIHTLPRHFQASAPKAGLRDTGRFLSPISTGATPPPISSVSHSGLAARPRRRCRGLRAARHMRKDMRGRYVARPLLQLRLAYERAGVASLVVAEVVADRHRASTTMKLPSPRRLLIPHHIHILRGFPVKRHFISPEPPDADDFATDDRHAPTLAELFAFSEVVVISPPRGRQAGASPFQLHRRMYVRARRFSAPDI